MSRPVILLVDDESDFLQIIGTAMERALPDYDVVCASTVGEAQDCLDDLQAQGTHLALAIVDHMLGGSGTGLPLIARIRKRFPGAPTFLFTGQAPARVEQHAMAGGSRVLWKPIRLKALLGEVTEALG